jgi:uncharacterized membrane protein YeaQ/YmgE (transglycosylase-associated protein family)
MNESMTFPARRMRTSWVLAVSTLVLVASWVFSLAVAAETHPGPGITLQGRLEVAVGDIWLPHAALAIQLAALAMAAWRLRVWNASGGSPLRAGSWFLQSIAVGAVGALVTGLLLQMPQHSTDTAFAAGADALEAGIVVTVVGAAVAALTAALLFLVRVHRVR